MRVLFAATPGVGHIFPMVPLAWAFQAAGHEILLATSGELGAAAKTGIPTVDVSPDVVFAEVFLRFAAGDPQSLMRETSLAWTALAKQSIDDADQKRLDLLGQMFGAVAEEMIDGMVEVASGWRPDLVVYSPAQGAGEFVAQKLGIPSVMHGVSPAHRLMIGPFRQALHLAMSESYRSRGVSVPDAHVRSITVAPPSLAGVDVGAWPMRAVPFNGGGLLPTRLLGDRERPYVAVTLGTVLPAFGGLRSLRRIVEVADQVDAEFLLAIGDDVDTTGLGTLPPNVRKSGWVPFGALVQRCAAAIHHGGSGTMFATMDAGTPQLVLPQGADQFLNAEFMSGAGLGITARPDDVDAALIKELLDNEDLRSKATLAACEMRAMPAPIELVQTLSEFAQAQLVRQ